MIQDVLFAGPTKKVFLKPTSKGVFREKVWFMCDII